MLEFKENDFFSSDSEETQIIVLEVMEPDILIVAGFTGENPGVIRLDFTSKKKLDKEFQIPQKYSHKKGTFYWMMKVSNNPQLAQIIAKQCDKLVTSAQVFSYIQDTKKVNLIMKAIERKAKEVLTTN